MASNTMMEERNVDLKAFAIGGSTQYDPSSIEEEMPLPARRKRAGAFHLEHELEQTEEVCSLSDL